MAGTREKAGSGHPLKETAEKELAETPRQDELKWDLAIHSETAEKPVELPFQIFQTTPFEEDAKLLQEKNMIEMFAEDRSSPVMSGIGCRVRKSAEFWEGEDYEEEIEEEEEEVEEEELELEAVKAEASSENIESEYVMGGQDFIQSEYIDQSWKEAKTAEPEQDFKPELADFQSQKSAESERSVEMGMDTVGQSEAEDHTTEEKTQSDDIPDEEESVRSDQTPSSSTVALIEEGYDSSEKENLMMEIEVEDENEPTERTSIYAMDLEDRKETTVKEEKKGAEEVEEEVEEIKVEVAEEGEEKGGTTKDKSATEVTSQYAFDAPLQSTTSEYLMDAGKQDKTSEQEGKVEVVTDTTQESTVAMSSEYIVDTQQRTEFPDAKKVKAEAKYQIPEKEGKDAATETIPSEVPEPEEEKEFGSTQGGSPDDQHLQETASEYVMDTVQATTTSEYLMDATAETTGTETELEDEDLDKTQQSQTESVVKTSVYIMDNQKRTEIPDIEVFAEVQMKQGKDLDTTRKRSPVATVTSEYLMDASAETTTLDVQVKDGIAQVKEGKLPLYGNQKGTTPDEVEAPGIKSEYVTDSLQHETSNAQKMRKVKKAAKEVKKEVVKQVKEEAMKEAKSSVQKTTKDRVPDIQHSGIAQQRESQVVTRQVVLPGEIPPISPKKDTEVQAEIQEEGEELSEEEYELVSCQFKIKLMPGGAVVVPQDDEQERKSEAEASFDLTPEGVWINKQKVWSGTVQN